jgi:hypothetical protein
MKENNNIVILLLPFWTPMIPSMSVASLKAYLEKNGYNIYSDDLNVDDNVRAFYYQYFRTISSYVPEDKHSNFYSIGHHVLHNHMCSYLLCEDETELNKLVSMFLEKTFYINFTEDIVIQLNNVLKEFFCWLEGYTLNLLETFNPSVFGLTVYRDTLPASIFAYQVVKKYNSEITTVMGGAIFSEQFTLGSPDLEYFLEISQPYLDKLIVGQGEKIFLKYLNNEFSYDERILTEQDINGEILGFNEIDIPDYSDISLDKYLIMGATNSNGCKYQCSFCNVLKYYGPFRVKDIKQSVDEVEKLYRKYSFQQYYFTDHMLNTIITPLSEEFTKRSIPFYWTGYLRVDEEGQDFNNVLQWRKGGFYCARLGVESGSQKVLDMIGKKITVEQIKKMVKNLAKTGIKTTTYWFVGHPGETEEDFQQTLDLIEELQDYIYEAESDYFNYNYDGQADSNLWSTKRKLVFPEYAKKYTIMQTWTVDCDPKREVIFDRLNRFVLHCKKHGIPNPYSQIDIYEADQRWGKLHKNAVPSLFEFNRKKIIDERAKILITD